MPVPDPSAVPAVEVRGLVKKYDGRPVVDRLDLVAHAGQVTAVLGPNGAGKTTTVECCEGLRSPDAGRIRVLGLDPVADAAELRPRVGVMLQDGGLPSGVPALGVLRHVARMYAAPRSVDELADRLGLRPWGRTTVRRLSGGQYRRLALATALVGAPDLVFLDEPTAGLDPQSRQAVHDLVVELRQEGVGVVLTTHLMDEAEALADRVVVVDRGRVVADGTVPELLSLAADRTLRFDAAPGLDLAALAAALGERLAFEEVTPGSYVGTGDVDPTALAALAAWCSAGDVLLTRMTVGRHSLEDVFLDLTGRELR